MTDAADVFAAFRSELVPQTPLRTAITAAYRAPEPECVPPLAKLATASADEANRIRTLAGSLVAKLRGKTRSSGVEGLIHEYSLSSQEGVALMCLAEALLRIPDAATRDALIRDKLSPGDWRAHVGQSPSLFVNAATWGLVLTGKLVTTTSEQGLSAALTRLIARSGEPIIRAGVDVAMRLMGEQFVTGRTIDEALGNSRDREARGFTFSYDMLGEAATTAEDAARYLDEYERAVHAIGRASRGRGIYEGAGISIKLSALHPRYQRIKRARVMTELMPRVKSLAALAKSAIRPCCHYLLGSVVLLPLWKSDAHCLTASVGNRSLVQACLFAVAGRLRLLRFPDQPCGECDPTGLGPQSDRCRSPYPKVGRRGAFPYARGFC